MSSSKTIDNVTVVSHLSQSWFFGLTIFLSAFLLFQIQPMISKYILPWFGGGPAVWTAAMLFFQVLLLGGYAYAHYLNRLKLQGQGRTHLGVLALVLFWIILMGLNWDTPITPDASWKPAAGVFPLWHVLWVLMAAVGLPYFLLSTTSSLVQSWYSKVYRQSSPYSFYVLSNVASLLALVSYPILFEPNWTVRQQAGFWSLAFVVYLLLVGLIALRISARNGSGEASSAQEDRAEIGAEETAAVRPSRKTYLFWISLALCASVMLLATTNQICQDIASIPFLWVLPLSLYLLSFVVAFNDAQQRFRSLNAVLMLVALFLGLLNLAYRGQMGIYPQIAANAFLLFVVALFCHSELYLRRPHPRYLTSFYLMLSIGGALGGVFVNLIAPLIFKDYWEYHLGLIYCAVIVILIAYGSRRTWLYRLRVPAAVTALTLAIFILVLPVLWVTKSVEMSRNFYGVLKIRASEMDGIPSYNMDHGAIVHGSQASVEPYRLRPTRYYTETSGVGLALLNHPNRTAGKSVRVGIIGLGVGTITTYGRPGDIYKFYEIDPEVIRYAQDERYFTYLRDSQADVELVLGDARLSLERELQDNQPGQFDVLVVDAFSGDSIPTHLVSKEAAVLYLAHLNKEGVLAFHVTNRHINLEAVLALLREHHDLEGVYISAQAKDGFGSDSAWVLLSRSSAFLKSPVIASAGRELVKTPGIRMWTDDYSNLFQVLWQR